MFAVAVYHRTTPGLLRDGSPAALGSASRTWIDFLARQPGFVEFISLANARADRVVAVSLWQSEEDFRRAAGQPDSAAARAGFAGLFTEVTPEFMTVEEYRRA
jgi:heme-degrading monooxygenase HmoA